MSNEKEYAARVDSGRKAESIISEPLFIASIETLRSLTVEKFESLGFGHTLEMQECNVRLNLIQEFENNFETVIQNGNAAFAALEEIQTFQQEINNER